LIDAFFNHINIKNNLESYYCKGFGWASTFNLKLANLVCPDEEWRVIYFSFVEIDEAVVINKNNTKIFDIGSWCYNGLNLWKYLFGDDKSYIDLDLDTHDDGYLGGSIYHKIMNN
jgi:hypothetical protein